MKEGKIDGFYGNRSIVLPPKILKRIKSNPLTNSLYITDIGYYPHATDHYRLRENGISENILIYCINGNGSIKSGEHLISLEANSLFIIPAHKPHEYWASNCNPWSIYWIHFAGDKGNLLKSFFGKVIQLDIKCAFRSDERVNLFYEILSALEKETSMENIVYANFTLYRLLATFLFDKTYCNVKVFYGDNSVDKAIFFMLDNINKFLTLSEIAEHINISESHLIKIFKNKTGTSPMDYFITLKMQKAIYLLKHNIPLRINEIAFSLGYDDQFYFSRVFKKHFGMCPMTYIKKSDSNN